MRAFRHSNFTEFDRFLTRSRGTRSWGWYLKYKNEGPAGFIKNNPPKPFDWKNVGQPSSRTKAFFDISIEKEPAGRITFELVDDLLPITCQNFKSLCSSDNKYSYKNTLIHRIIKGSAVMGGDVEMLKGKGTHSAFENRYFKDEAFIIPHMEPYLLTMANSGVDTNGSQFFITTVAAPHLNGRCVAFGRLISGQDTLQKVHDVYCKTGIPIPELKIHDCGLIEK